METSKFANKHGLHEQPKRQNPSPATKVKREPMKIKYISSPMLVKARNASEFRAIVQELTGQHSEDRSDPHQSYTMITNHAEPQIKMVEENVACEVSRTMPLLELNKDYLWENFSDSFYGL